MMRETQGMGIDQQNKNKEVEESNKPCKHQRLRDQTTARDKEKMSSDQSDNCMNFK